MIFELGSGGEELRSRGDPVWKLEGGFFFGMGEVEPPRREGREVLEARRSGRISRRVAEAQRREEIE